MPHAIFANTSFSLLLISGSLRAGSTNSAVLRTLQAVAPESETTTSYDGMARLPHFNPDDDVEALDSDVVGLRAAIGAAGGLMVCTPEYAGALPGSFKNLLDWTVGGGEMFGKPVGWINASWGPTGVPTRMPRWAKSSAASARRSSRKPARRCPLPAT